MEFIEKSLTQIIKDLNSGKITSEQLVLLCKEQIEKTKNLNALNSTCYDDALQRAKQIDQRRKNGEKLGKLGGAVVVIKDNINKIGTKTTCSSKLLENYQSVYNATVVEKIEQADGIIIGKANMDEFAMGSSNENSYFGAVHNPVDYDRVPGGSSGGSACSVKANQCYASLGTDTGGSVREPASFCGVVGLKPTYSRVSRYGVVAFASSLDQVGPLTKTVEDSALMLEVLAGYDPKENTSSKQPVLEYSKLLADNIKGKKIGIAKEFFALGMDKEVESAVYSAIEFYKNNGAEIVDVSLKNIDLALATYYVLSSAEASSNLGRFDGIRYGYQSQNFDSLESLYTKTRTEGFGREVKRRIMLGNFVLSSGYFDAYYKKAQKVQALLKQEFEECFKKCDVLLSPVSPTTAFKIGEKMNDHIQMYLSDIYTVPVNVVECPALSFPCGKDSKGLPIGLQLIGKKFDEQTLFDLANYFEKHKEDKN